MVQGQRRSMSAPAHTPRSGSLGQKELAQDPDCVLRRGDAVARDARVVVELVVVPALARLTSQRTARRAVKRGSAPPPERSRARTSKVLSPKKWIVLKPSDSRWRSAYVLSQPTGNTSNEIWPPVRSEHAGTMPWRIRRYVAAASATCPPPPPPGGQRTDRVLEAVVGELALQVLDKLAPDAVLQVVLFKLVALGVAVGATTPTQDVCVTNVSGRRNPSRRGGSPTPHLQLRPMGETLIMPLRNSTKVPLAPMERNRGRAKRSRQGARPDVAKRRRVRTASWGS